jgi:hypothetical protein
MIAILWRVVVVLYCMLCLCCLIFIFISIIIIIIIIIIINKKSSPFYVNIYSHSSVAKMAVSHIRRARVEHSSRHKVYSTVYILEKKGSSSRPNTCFGWLYSRRQRLRRTRELNTKCVKIVNIVCCFVSTIVDKNTILNLSIAFVVHSSPLWRTLEFYLW